MTSSIPPVSSSANYSSAPAASGAPARTPLQKHLDFFDRNKDGKVSIAESYAGFRSVGTGVLMSAVKAAMSGVLFGTWLDGFRVDIDRLAPRPSGTTGIMRDPSRLEEFLGEFDKRGKNGVMTEDQLKTLLKEHDLAWVPTQQFKSLMNAAEAVNGERVIAKHQFRQFYEGGFLYEVKRLVGTGS
jgi:hypothetical protein